jgi:heme/copper-type cytochrome/quinol oxidase subunit 2
LTDRPQTESHHPAAWQNLRLILLAIAVSVLIILLVVASRPVSVEGDSQQVNQGPVIAIVHAVEIFGISIEVLAIVLWLVVSRMAKREEEEDDTYREPTRVPWWVKLIVTAIPLVMLGLIIYSIYRFLSGGQVQSFDLSGLVAPAPGNGGPSARDVADVFGLAWWEYGISLALVIAVLAVIVWAFRRDASDESAAVEPATRAEILSYAVDLGLDDARRERDPRKAVIAAYATMERILAEEGLPRQRTEAPLEYMSRLFAELGIGNEPIRALTDLFEMARFSHHPIIPAMKERAIAALETLHRELEPAP